MEGKRITAAAGADSVMTSGVPSAGCPRTIMAPTTEQLVQDLGGYVIALWVVGSMIVLILIGLLVKTTVFINTAAPTRWRRKIVWVNSIYPFVCLMCLGSLVVPASSNLLSAIAVTYMSNGVSKFLDLCLMYFGGETLMLETVGDVAVPLAVPPLCCCCCLCCPRPAMSKRYLKVMRVLVHQLPFTQSAYCLLSLYLYLADVGGPRQTAFKGGFVYLTVFNVVSFMSAMYGLLIFQRLTRGHLPHYHYTAKLMLMKFTLMIVKLQDIIFDVAIRFGGVSSTSSMSPQTYGAFIRDITVLLEMWVFGLLAHKLYNAPDQYGQTTDEEKELSPKSGGGGSGSAQVKLSADKP